MELATYVERLRSDLSAAAEAASTEVREAADRLSFAVEPSMRMALLEALGDATADITSKLESAVVEVRLHGRDPEFVVAEHGPQPPQPPQPPAPPEPPTPPEPAEPLAADADEGMSRVSLRLPDKVKSQVEQAAAAAGQSVNAWLVKAAVEKIERRSRGDEAQATASISFPVGQRLTGWQR